MDSTSAGPGSTDWQALLNSGGAPKAVPLPSADSVAEAVNRCSAEHEQAEAAARAALREIVREKIGLHLEGHRGVVKQLRAAVYDTAADAAVDAFIDCARGGITHAEITGPGALNVTPRSVILNGIEYVPKQPDPDYLPLPNYAFDDVPGPGWSALVDEQRRIAEYPVVDMLDDTSRDHEWIDNHGRRWEWSDINGWVVDRMATMGGHTPKLADGPFKAVR